MFSFSTSHNRLLEKFSAHPKSVTLKSPRSCVHPAYRAGLEYRKNPAVSAALDGLISGRPRGSLQNLIRCGSERLSILRQKCPIHQLKLMMAVSHLKIRISVSPDGLT